MRTFASKPWVRPGDISRYALVAYRLRCPEVFLQAGGSMKATNCSHCWSGPWSAWLAPTVSAVSTAVKLRRHPLVFGHYRCGTRCITYRDHGWFLYGRRTYVLAPSRFLFSLLMSSELRCPGQRSHLFRVRAVRLHALMGCRFPGPAVVARVLGSSLDRASLTH